MSNYHITPTSLPSYAAQEAKVQRKQQLEQIRKRRIQQEQERRTRQQRAYQTNADYRDYQDKLKEEAKLYR